MQQGTLVSIQLSSELQILKISPKGEREGNLGFEEIHVCQGENIRHCRE